MLPDNNFEMDEITDKADILIDEPWYMIFGKELWKKIVGNEDDDITIVSELFKMDDEKFNTLMTHVLVGDTDANALISDLVRKARYNYDYANFEKDLARRREENNILIDGGGIIDDESIYST